MRILLFLLFSFLLLQGGCASSQETTNDDSMAVVNATYKKWSDPSPTGSDIPERGTDLTVSVQHWPEDYSPQYIIYDNQGSNTANITNKAGVTVFITARIIHTSSVLPETATETDLSDRLVYTDAEGDTSYVEIENWYAE